jgi:hypothetical protein
MVEPHTDALANCIVAAAIPSGVPRLTAGPIDAHSFAQAMKTQAETTQ